MSAGPPLRSVLIANRGEIALRIARACREAGIRAIAVYSTEDQDSAAVRFADEAVHIGPAPAQHSYLNMAAIIEAARRTGAEAVHPGYGFLSESSDFAEACAASGLLFIGPPPAVIETLNDKTSARRLMASAGLPVLPGSLGPVNHAEDARAVAGETGYPLIIKAAAGGGGRGIRVVREPADLGAAYREVRASAQTLFGDSRVYLERYLESPRHVEVQVLCDGHGAVVHLGERDCTVQRRHQKLVEESPAPGVAAAIRDRMAEAAVRGALAAGYVGAGTFEFLVDTDGGWYFIEANPRIQVEHPVTEMVTGIDLVAQQFQIAAGRPLRMRQDDVCCRGVAIECRINAEDPDRGFAPAPGTLTEFSPPAGPFVRVDTHGHPGYRIARSYDSLLAKVVVWAPDRSQAMARMLRALSEFTVAGPGVATTGPLLAKVIGHPLFRDAKHDTGLVDDILLTRA
ncbi:MAG TPA: acetyl-CoA carboxylase biotin carboxylase subunit [Streptosporangiaceae bacterium]|nr:acetyl-CoA carboxylase biotin carboxylase subunit [Streptosporangiaceae bacterium]